MTTQRERKERATAKRLARAQAAMMRHFRCCRVVSQQLRAVRDPLWFKLDAMATQGLTTWEGYSAWASNRNPLKLFMWRAVDNSFRVSIVGSPFTVEPCDGSELARAVADYQMSVLSRGRDFANQGLPTCRDYVPA